MISEAIRSTYSCVSRIKDLKFDVDRLAVYSLVFELSEKDFFVLVVDTEQNQAMYLEHFKFQELYQTKDLLEQLSMLFDEHHFLKAGFWKEIKFIIKNKKFAFVPNSLYAEDKRNFFLKLNAEVSEEDVLFTSTFKGTEARCVFAINQGLDQWVKSLYPSKTIVLDHASNIFCDAVTRDLTAKVGNELFVYADSFTLTLVGLKDGHLHYCNIFSYSSAEDLAYYIMLVMHELDFNPEVATVCLFGEIDQTSMHFTKLRKYLRHLSLGKRPNHLRFSFVFDETYDHQYFELFSAYQQK